MKTNALKGMKDILPQEQRLRDYVQSKILETYRASGFERISTPMLEDAENLDKSDGGDNLNLIFKVLKRGDKLESALAANPVEEKNLSDMGLRYDLTLPLTRFFFFFFNELGIFFNKLTPWFNLVTHKGCKSKIKLGYRFFIHVYTEQCPAFWIHCCFP